MKECENPPRHPTEPIPEPEPPIPEPIPEPPVPEEPEPPAPKSEAEDCELTILIDLIGSSIVEGERSGFEVNRGLANYFVDMVDSLGVPLAIGIATTPGGKMLSPTKNYDNVRTAIASSIDFLAKLPYADFLHLLPDITSAFNAMPIKKPIFLIFGDTIIIPNLEADFATIKSKVTKRDGHIYYLLTLAADYENRDAIKQRHINFSHTLEDFVDTASSKPWLDAIIDSLAEVT